MTKCEYLLLFVFAFLCKISVNAQIGKLFNTDNGLSSTLATQAIQNHDGRIIIATRNGLNIYDGYGFKVITQLSALGQGLESNYFNSICENKDGLLLVATNTGVFSFDGQKFTPYYIYDDKHHTVRTYVNQLNTCPDGTVLACTSGYGIQVIAPDGKDNECRPLKGAITAYPFILKAMKDHSGRLWAITGDSKLVMQGHNGRLSTEFQGLKTASAKCMTEDNGGASMSARATKAYTSYGRALTPSSTSTRQHPCLYSVSLLPATECSLPEQMAQASLPTTRAPDMPSSIRSSATLPTSAMAR